MIDRMLRRQWMCGAILVAASLAFPAGTASAIDFPGPDPGPARAAIQGDTITLENNVLKFTWSTAGGRLKPKEFVDKLNGRAISLADSKCFQIVLDKSPSPQPLVEDLLELNTENTPRVSSVKATNYQNSRDFRQVGFRGVEVTVDLKRGRWLATLLDGSNYVSQYVSNTTPPAYQWIIAWDLAAPDVQFLGSVDGCPITAGTLFCGSDSPSARSDRFDRSQTGNASQRCRQYADCQASVIGVVPKGQMRRGFLYYLERERAHAYRPFLHYNNGSEIGCDYWGKRLHKNAAEAEQFRMKQQDIWLHNIRALGDELVKKRGVTLDSFVHDFEWDDETLVWQFHRGYPQGFVPAVATANDYGAGIGVWFSPWGGYPCQPARVEFGRKMGFETSPMGLSLAGPRYYQRFRTACLNMIHDYGANYFKFDGFAAGNNQPGPGPYASDVGSLLWLAEELRQTKAYEPKYRGVFINATTGSWPSPFWLLYVDSIWRQGNDTGMLGKGSDRQRWITYRDNEVFHRIVKQSPLFPLNSLMIHGVFVNELPFEGNPYDPKNPRASVVAKDVIDEIRTFFGTGTGCQEMYINPKLMTAELWDALAEAANWSRKNPDVLVDTHWIGGDPAKGEIYGYASWSKRQGILSLRNPDDKPAQFALDIGQAFELPPGAPSRYKLKSPWKRDAARPAVEVTAGKPHALVLAPFESLVLEATPMQPGK